MMKKKLFLTAILTLICCMLLIAGASANLEGIGTADDPYQISNAAELIAFADIVNDGQNAAHAVLTANITVNENVLKTDGSLNGTPANAWTPIGESDSEDDAYTGNFDGRGHTISGLYTMVETYNTTAYAGLFGCVGGGGEVKNVNIADSYICASIKESNPSGNNKFAAAGSVCGKNNGGTIENCTNSGTVVVEDGNTSNSACYAGGVCGLNTHTNTDKGKISGCANSGSVSGYGHVGGVCGSTGHLTVNCGNTGSVSGSGYVGGVCGQNGGTITNCYWLEDTVEYGNNIGQSKTADDFASGEVTWLLNKGQTAGPWRQNLGKGEDAEPVLDATHGEVICIYIDNTPVYANPDNVTLPDPGPGKAYFDETGEYVDPETYKFTDGMRIHLEDAITASFVYGDGTSVTQMVKEDISSVVMPDAPSKPGYIFLGWRSGDMTYLPGDEVGLYGDTTFTAVWANMPDITPSEPDSPDEPDALPFGDVSEDAWYYDAVKTVVEAGLMKGVSDTDFAPNGILNRAMFWTLLARAEGVDTDGGATWYSVAQQWAIDNGVSDGTDPMGALTREQLVTMLWRLNGEPVVNYLITTPDAGQISSWALEAMRWAASTGLIEGDETGALNPTATCTRAQAATFMVRYLTPVTA